MDFLKSKDKFDQQNSNIKTKYKQFLSEHLSFNKQIKLYKKDGYKNEQYYKWQFLFAIID